MTTREAPNLFRHVWKSVLAWGVLTLILGVVVLVWPGKSILVAAVLFGIYLLGSGIAQLIFALTLDASGGERALLFISGALSIVLGVLAFRHFEEGWPILLLAIWIGVAFIFQGVAETALATSYPQLPERGWHIFLGVLSIIAGMVVMAWPFSSIVMLAIVTGVWLVIIGTAQIAWALLARKGINSIERAFERTTTSTAS
jgi:uncharacterized membrane protein HdeD (DUF308 family)